MRSRDVPFAAFAPPVVAAHAGASNDLLVESVLGVAVGVVVVATYLLALRWFRGSDRSDRGDRTRRTDDR